MVVRDRFRALNLVLPCAFLRPRFCRYRGWRLFRKEFYVLLSNTRCRAVRFKVVLNSANFARLSLLLQRRYLESTELVLGAQFLVFY